MRATKSKVALLSVAVASMLTVSLSGCKKADVTKWNKEGEYTLLDFTAVSPSNWNELTYQDNNDTQIMEHIGSAFFAYDYNFDSEGNLIDDEYRVVYSAATKLEDVTTTYAGNASWGIPAGTKNFRAYKITLRNDLKWDDGTPIKAEDFVYTMKEQLNPLFKNYRADSYYNSSLVIHNARNYVYQGSKGWFASTMAYSTYDTSLDDKLIFSIGSPLSKEDGGDGALAVSDIRTYLGASDAVTAAQVAAAIASNVKTITAEQVLALEGKTFAEIKADSNLKATWDAIIAWWQTEPNEELHFFVAEYTFPELSFDQVGIFVGETEYEIVLILDNPLQLLKEDGSLSYKAAYNLSSLPLVHKQKFEENKVAPSSSTGLWTSTYNSDLESTASWGPYKLVFFQAGKEYVLERNENWFGYNLEMYEGQYQTTRIAVETISEWNTAWLKFQKGSIDSIGIDVSIAQDYKNSERAIFTPSDYVASLQLQSDVKALKSREKSGIDKEILGYTDFRKALSLSINRANYTSQCTTSSLPGYGLFNSMHYYDVENNGIYRNEDVAKQVLCDVYAVDVDGQFGGDLDAATEAITGYDLVKARELLISAYNQALEDGVISATDKVELVFGTGAINESINRQFEFFKNSWETLFKTTPLEGRLVMKIEDKGEKWAEDFKAGGYDVCMGGWTGAAWDPGYFLLAYLSPDYMYSTAWDTSSQMLTYTVPGVGEGGTDLTLTMSLMDWYKCLNGLSGAKYNWSEGAVSNSVRLGIIAALEKEVLSVYYTVPVANSFSAQLLSYKVDYASTNYNTFMAYGGVRYMTYNYDDAAWNDYAKSHKLDYKA